jgi:hypothetical protein
MAKSQLRRDQLVDQIIDNSKVDNAAAIATTKLADGADFIQRDGSVEYTADQSMGNNKITNLATPTNSTDAATKAYVDSAIEGLDPKQSVRVATTANITLSGTQTIDGVGVISGDRVLVRAQTLPRENGIYVVASGAWSRATDMDAWTEVPGAYAFVEEGTVEADKGYVCTSNSGGTLDTTDITWVQFNGSGSGLTDSEFVFNETPSGSINGSNTAFTLANTPVSGSVQVFRNGQLQLSGAGNDYTISGATITYEYAPVTGEVLKVSYIIS